MEGRFHRQRKRCIRPCRSPWFHPKSRHCSSSRLRLRRSTFLPWPLVVFGQGDHFVREVLRRLLLAEGSPAKPCTTKQTPLPGLGLTRTDTRPAARLLEYEGSSAAKGRGPQTATSAPESDQSIQLMRDKHDDSKDPVRHSRIRRPHQFLAAFAPAISR